MAIKITNDGVDFESIDVIRAFVVIVFWAFIGVNIYGTCVNTQSIAEHFKKEEQVNRIQTEKNHCIKACPNNYVHKTVSMSPGWPNSVSFDWDDPHKQCVDNCDARAATETDSVWQ